MCGRYTLTVPVDRLAVEFGLDEVRTEVSPNFNVAPTQEVARSWPRAAAGVSRCSGGGSSLRGRTTRGSADA
jgi:hypothetical protein